jgi:hypothetical protein
MKTLQCIRKRSKGNMKIDITREPPADIFRDRVKYIALFCIFLTLAAIGMSLGGYAILSDTRYYDLLETVSLVLFVGASPVIFYFGEKLQKYKRLTLEEENELADLVLAHAEIKVYCGLVAKAGRQPIKAEYEACLTWAEEASGRIGPKNL